MHCGLEMQPQRQQAPHKHEETYLVQSYYSGLKKTMLSCAELLQWFEEDYAWLCDILIRINQCTVLSAINSLKYTIEMCIA